MIYKILNKIWLFINNILRSLDNVQNSGYSARKLTGLMAVMIAAFISIHQLPVEYKLHAIYSWQITALVSLGIITAEQIIKIKYNNESKK